MVQGHTTGGGRDSFCRKWEGSILQAFCRQWVVILQPWQAETRKQVSVGTGEGIILAWVRTGPWDSNLGRQPRAASRKASYPAS